MQVRERAVKQFPDSRSNETVIAFSVMCIVQRFYHLHAFVPVRLWQVASIITLSQAMIATELLYLAEDALTDWELRSTANP